MRRIFVLALAAATLVALSIAPVADAKTCNISGKERTFGTTYVYTLKVRNVSCSTGGKVVRAYHACRKRNGGRRGRCSGVYSYRCKETRMQAIRTQFDAKVNCVRGSRVVYHAYQQNL